MVIRGGTVYDGTGSTPLMADIAIDGQTITKVGEVSNSGRKEIDASGQIATPGFVDIHTLYDRQITWQPLPANLPQFHGRPHRLSGANCRGWTSPPCQTRLNPIGLIGPQGKGFEGTSPRHGALG